MWDVYIEGIIETIPGWQARPHPTVLLYKLHHVPAATDASITFVYIYLHKAVDSRPSDQGCHVEKIFSLYVPEMRSFRQYFRGFLL